MSKTRPDDWIERVKRSIRVLVVGRRVIRKSDLQCSLVGLMWEYMLSDEEVVEVINDMLSKAELGLVIIEMPNQPPEKFYTLPGSDIIVVNNNK